MKISMRDVAVHAGVSVATVSHVINNTRFVAEETRQKVLDSISSLNYYPNSIARSFKTGKRNLIGFIVPDIANNFFSTIIEEVENVLAQHQYKLIITNTKETSARELENIGTLTSGIVDGLIIASTLQSYAQLKSILPKKFPAVFIDRVFKNCPYDTISIKNYESLYKGIENLILNGNKKIGYITGLPHLSTTIERRQAYEDVMKNYGLPIEKDFIQIADSMANSAQPKVKTIIDAGCTAIVVSNNIMSEDVLNTLVQMGRTDIHLLGYSDSNHRYFVRKFDCISQPLSELGQKAGNLIIDRIENPDTSPKHIILHSSYFTKETSPDN